MDDVLADLLEFDQDVEDGLALALRDVLAAGADALHFGVAQRHRIEPAFNSDTSISSQKKKQE